MSATETQEPFKAWVTTYPSLQDVGIQILKLPQSTICALIDNRIDDDYRLHEALEDLNNLQRQLIMNHAEKYGSTLYFVDIWRKERVVTWYGKLELTFLIWVTSGGTTRLRNQIGGEKANLDQNEGTAVVEYSAAAEESVVGEAENAEEAEVDAGETDEAGVNEIGMDKVDTDESETDQFEAAQSEPSEPNPQDSQEPYQAEQPTPTPAPVKLHDTRGRTFVLPYHLVLTLSGIQTFVTTISHHNPSSSPCHIEQERYDLTDISTGAIILPSVWEHFVQPGLEVGIEAWPIDEGVTLEKHGDVEPRLAVRGEEERAEEGGIEGELVYSTVMKGSSESDMRAEIMLQEGALEDSHQAG